MKKHENARLPLINTFYKPPKGLFLLIHIFVKYGSPTAFGIWKSNGSAGKYVLK